MSIKIQCMTEKFLVITIKLGLFKSSSTVTAVLLRNTVPTTGSNNIKENKKE